MLSFEPRHPNPFINELIHQFCTIAKQQEGREVYYGSIHEEEVRIPSSFEYVWAWSDGFRKVYISSEDLATITTCEGDISVSLCEDRQSFEAEMRGAEKFYETH